MTQIPLVVDVPGTMAGIDRLRAAVSFFIRGKPEVVDLALTCLLGSGHLLLEDVPGVGKTSLARSLATASGVPWSRIQFTPDVLPSDLTGVSVFHPGRGGFEFHPGPVFTSIVLADEINRASPRTQAALLEAMEERTVSVDGTTHELPRPFMVIATQNPIDMAGTYPLPEAQMDRFMIRASLGYPDVEAETEVLTAHHMGMTPADVPSSGSSEVESLISACAHVEVAPEVMRYVAQMVAATRSAGGVVLGASPRGSIALLRASRARALMNGRGYVVPGDLQALAVPVLAHRLVLDADAAAGGMTAAGVVAAVVESVPAPQSPQSR